MVNTTKNITFITIANKAYWLGFAALVESIKTNSDLHLKSYQFLAYSSEPIPEYVLNWANEREESIKFIVGKELNEWNALAPQRYERLQESFKKIGLFGINPQGTDLHVFIDSDIICLNPLTDIFKYEAFAGVPYQSDHKTYKPWSQHPSFDHINGGFFIFEPSKEDRKQLINLYQSNPENYCLYADQDLLADWIAKGKTVTPMPQEWNCLKGIIIPINGKLNQSLLKNVKLLHFTGTNPWDLPTDIRLSEGRFLRIELLWWAHFQNSGIRPPKGAFAHLGKAIAYRRTLNARTNFIKNKYRRFLSRWKKPSPTTS